jgi:hypothetical protein
MAGAGVMDRGFVPHQAQAVVGFNILEARNEVPFLNVFAEIFCFLLARRDNGKRVPGFAEKSGPDNC